MDIDPLNYYKKDVRLLLRCAQDCRLTVDVDDPIRRLTLVLQVDSRRPTGATEEDLCARFFHTFFKLGVEEQVPSFPQKLNVRALEKCQSASVISLLHYSS